MKFKLASLFLFGALSLGVSSPAKSVLLAQSPTTQVAVDNFESLKKLLFNPQGGMVAGAVVTMMVLSWRSDGTGSKAKNRLATSRWAGPKERSAARKKAHQQVNDRRANSVSLCIASPKLTYLPIARSKPKRAIGNADRAKSG